MPQVSLPLGLALTEDGDHDGHLGQDVLGLHDLNLIPDLLVLLTVLHDLLLLGLWLRGVK